MRSAQRRSLKKANNPKGKPGLFIKAFIPLALILIAFFYVKLSTKIWNGSDKVSFAYPLDSGDVAVTVLDPKLSEQTTIVIPGETLTDVARGYGSLRIKNVWQLGLNEKLAGNLLAETVTQSFRFPTVNWSESGLENPKNFIFSPGKTNIGFGDRLLMAIFSLRVKGIDESEINLGTNQYLKKQTLTDGQPGYILVGPISNRLTVYFSDNAFSEKSIKYRIVDSTGKPGISDRVGEILEVMGGKVVSVERLSKDETLDCSVSGNEADAVIKVSKIFSCNKSDEKTEFDVDLKVGSGFAKRF